MAKTTIEVKETNARHALLVISIVALMSFLGGVNRNFNECHFSNFDA